MMMFLAKFGSAMDMKYRISYLPIAGRDILRISDAFINYPNKAKRLFREMEKKLRILEDIPYTWPVCQVKPKKHSYGVDYGNRTFIYT